ncbi:alpha/beta hydrolase [Pseudoxanthomonas broegbernensis]|uniref:Alpha/beta hydrolase n=1 Tax=Pseudoxanthomonas broegbernensis TaxID=83619 RepID=A0A7V8GQ25_9GAMM|nr:alpha/beta fold hydrolase [Pseudoxanthomonas broegbernensis]KAF1688057.1 alpha/beta hydrolase [Pseudoxanthomonas broegbernensis]MBB6065089.1 pimeloyl-ACP methyl ester carboxylesterase [Pseudoxanthomonas broegbernensis]
MLRWAFAIGGWVAPGATLRQASRLFATPLPSSRGRALAAACDDAGIGRVHSRGDALTTYAWGDPATQPYVLFSHGWSSFGLRCRPWVAPLRRAGYAVVAFDHPGHGRNEGGAANLPAFAAALAAVARAHGAPAAVVAHSMGGAAALLALVEGLQAGRVVLLAPAADLRAAGRRFGRALGLAPALVARMFEGFERQLGLPVDSLAAHRHAPALGLPALVVHDLEDDEVPWEEGERYARLWPGARLLTTRGLGHHRIAGEPAVIEAALGFLRGEAVGERVVSSPNLPFGIG